MAEKVWWCVIHDDRANTGLDRALTEGHWRDGVGAGCYRSLWMLQPKWSKFEEVGNCVFIGRQFADV